MAERLVFWGTYDTGKPRVRLLLEGARRAGFEVIECHRSVWGGVEDKSQLGRGQRVRRLLAWLAAYPWLVLRYLRLPRHRRVIVGYLGLLDVLVLWPFARLRGARLIWDVFVPLVETVVEDRGLVGPRSPLARLLWLAEALAARAADRCLLDTRAQANAFERRFRLQRGSVGVVWVGAELSVFPPAPPLDAVRERALRVLFYGQFIPLHGLETLVEAAAALSGEPVEWTVIGRGQTAAAIDARIAALGLTSIERIDWVGYPELAGQIARADVCLGIFGTSAKARQVIPNKAYQVLACGRPLITADTPGSRELLSDADRPWVRLVPPGEPAALARAVRQTAQWLAQGPPGPAPTRAIVGAPTVGRQLARWVRASRRVRRPVVSDGAANIVAPRSLIRGPG